MKIHEYPDRDMAAIAVADRLASELEAALLHHERVVLAVPGGTTPGPVFDILCAADLDWARVSVTLTDERWVGQDHPRSNAGLVVARLLTDRAAAATFQPLYAPAEEPEHVLAEISSQFDPLLPLSVLLLGMGADMHTASLFPGAPGLAEAMGSDAPTLCALRPADQPEARVSFSAPVLNGALSKHLLIFGPEKRNALERAQSLPVQDAPIHAVLSGIEIHWAE